jgi:ATP-dependent 26S proteasome regulatory subunit
MPTRSQTRAAELAATLRARNPLVIIRTAEEHRVEPWLFEAAASAGYIARTWDVAAGVCQMDGKPLYPDYNGEPDDRQVQTRDPGVTLNNIATAARDQGATRENPRRFCWIMRDLSPFLSGPGSAPTVRQLRNLCRMFPDTMRAQPVIILTPSTEVPPELAGHATVLDWPLPDREEIAAMLDSAIANLPEELRANAAPNGTREAAIDAAVGLSGFEAENCYASSLVRLKGRIDPAIVNKEKKRIIAASRVLELMEPLEGGFDAIGGLDVIKSWITMRKVAYSPRARAYGLPAPKGIFMVGLSGCGKTYISKAIATELGRLPLYRLDTGALQSKYVGESQANLRKALSVIDSSGPCVVLIDEVEKAMAGATQGAADGGVSADALGTLLTWMQERTGQAFLVATSNDASQLPPEFLRKGRWDELFWVDLPTEAEREQILLASLAVYKRQSALSLADRITVASATSGFSGAEIAALVPDALFAAFADNERELTAQDLIAVASTLTPLSVTAKEKIEKARAWSKGRARPATTPEVADVGNVDAPKRRALDL